MKKLARIPSPPSHYWREFRHSFMPLIVFGGVLTLTVLMWRNHLLPVGIVGEVETVRANVNTTLPGTLVDLQVDLLQQVEKDQVIATVTTVEPEMLNASLAAVNADFESLKVRLAMDQSSLVMDQMRNTDAIEQLRITWLNTKVSLATERVNLQYAINEFQRASKLFQEKAITEMEYDLSRNRRDALQSKVDEMSKLIVETERSMERVNTIPAMPPLPSSEVVMQAIKAKQEEIKMNARPLLLRAPMAGVVSAVLRRSGERLVAGDSVVTISGLQSDRIVGYVRQPLNQKPMPGATVTVRSRAGDRAMGEAKILRVGTQLEAINPVLLQPSAAQSRIQEFGLPILVSLPSNLKLIPGEMVDIQITVQ